MVKKIKKRGKQHNRGKNLSSDGSGFSDQAVNKLREAYSNYSLHDIASSLFVSSLWLPNIASPIKHQFMTCVLASMKPEELSSIDSINNYQDFRILLEASYKILPSFPTVEDYIPETDWGDVKFFYNEQSYKIFYGQELSNVYDYLTLFQVLHLPIDNEYKLACEVSPVEDFRTCLQIQDDIISGISPMTNEDDLSRLSLGHIEVPSQGFWDEAFHFYSGYTLEEVCDKQFLSKLSIPLGKWDAKNLKDEIFYQKAFEGANLPYYFILHNNKCYPVLPKRYSAILFDHWGDIYNKRHKEIIESDSHRLKISAKVNHYIKERVSSSFLYPLVSAVIDFSKLHDFIFDAALISKDRLIFIYITSPYIESGDIEKELDALQVKITEALSLISNLPMTLALHLERMNVQFQGEGLKPYVYVVIPQSTTRLASLTIPQSFPAELVFLDQFLGLIDELEDVDDLCTFIEYLEEYRSRISAPFISTLDFYGSFKDSLGTLEEGAMSYTMISIDPHWGSSIRYKTLSEFWSNYPDIKYWMHPRSWEVIKETESRTRLVARGVRHFVIHCTIGITNVLINGPFDEMNYEQGMLVKFIMECIEDTISRNKDLLEGLPYFNNYPQLQIFIVPLTLIKGKDKFKHLNHLQPTDSLWLSDVGIPDGESYGIRMVVDDNSLQDAFAKVNNRELEIELTLEVVRQLNTIIPDSAIHTVTRELISQKPLRPRFKFFEAKLPATFPQLINPYKPENKHFKQAKKQIALVAKECHFDEGKCKLDDAKNKLNSLITAIVQYINSEMEKLDFESTIHYLITRIDALSHRYESDTTTLEYSLEHDVDYDRHEDYAKKHHDYLVMHKSYRYLIEKLIQINPSGTQRLDKEQFQYLIAITDWLHVFYSASDSIHYAISPIGMKVSSDLRVEIVHEDDMLEKEKGFAEKEARMRLGTIGSPDDRVSSPRGIESYIDELDKAFKSELRFIYINMLSVLDIFSHWANAEPKCEVSPYYEATDEEIYDKVHRIIPEVSKDEVANILDFLTLKTSEVLYLTGSSDKCSDLPVWEYKKRFARYNLRPFIQINDKFIWGPYSTRKSASIWAGSHYYGTMPIVFLNPKIQQTLDSEKRLIEEALEAKTLEIIKRFTPMAEKNVKLHRRDKTAGHPPDLGDYDILAYLQDKNIILNIECKDVVPAFSLKDAKTLRETIFGKTEQDRGQFSQILKREKYLEANVRVIFKALGWNMEEGEPRIMTLYIARRTYWWTEFPPDDIKAVFLQVDMLDEFLGQLC